VPEAVANILMVDQDTAPALFAEQPKEAKPERERPAKEHRPEKRKHHAPSTHEGEQGDGVEQAASEEQMHLESLVNFVAFNRREQQRTFLPVAHCIPPPPPRKPKPNANQNKDKEPTQESPATTAATGRANAEAQMVLRGAARVPSRGAAIARGLHAQLTDIMIEISATTFELMVDVCIQARDLQCASDFLMRMEASNFAPSNDLLDRVMELYLVHKRNSNSANQSEADVQATSIVDADPAWTGGQSFVADGSMSHLCQPGTAAMHPAHPQYDTAPGSHLLEMPTPLQQWYRQQPHRFPGVVSGMLPSPQESCHTSNAPTQQLPAFSVPDEFATKQASEKAMQVEPACDSAELMTERSTTGLLPSSCNSVQPGMTDLVGASRAGETGRLPNKLGASQSKLSADAAVFVPSDAQTGSAALTGMGAVSASMIPSRDVSASPVDQHWASSEKENSSSCLTQVQSQASPCNGVATPWATSEHSEHLCMDRHVLSESATAVGNYANSRHMSRSYAANEADGTPYASNDSRYGGSSTHSDYAINGHSNADPKYSQGGRAAHRYVEGSQYTNGPIGSSGWERHASRKQYHDDPTAEDMPPGPSLSARATKSNQPGAYEPRYSQGLRGRRNRQQEF